MLLNLSAIMGLLSFYVACPRCKKLQHFKGNKKGETVTCKRCNYEFQLKK